jgi:hypothetical protein
MEYATLDTRTKFRKLSEDEKKINASERVTVSTTPPTVEKWSEVYPMPLWGSEKNKLNLELAELSHIYIWRRIGVVEGSFTDRFFVEYVENRNAAEVLYKRREKLNFEQLSES